VQIRNRSTEPRRAAAAVEFAVVLPLILLLLFGVWEVGRLVEVQQVLSNAAREGGRQASTGQRTVAQVRQGVVDYIARAGLPTGNVNVTITNMTDGSRPEPNEANQLDRFRIRVTMPSDDVRWILLNQITNGTTISGVADWYSMRDVPLEIDSTLPRD